MLKNVLLLWCLVSTKSPIRCQDGLALRGGEEGAEEPGVEPLRRGLEEDRGPGRVLRPRIPLLRQVYILIY